MDNLVGINPRDVLPHGDSKRLVDEYIWHKPDTGIVASYIPTAEDVKDHFGVFRGVDQIESFAQATVVSMGIFLEAVKANIAFGDMLKKYNTAFMGVKDVKFHSFLNENDKFICVGKLEFYRFRQLVCSGKIFSCPKELNLVEHFQNFNQNDLLDFNFGSRFKLITEIESIIGKGVKKNKFKKGV